MTCTTLSTTMMAVIRSFRSSQLLVTVWLLHSMVVSVMVNAQQDNSNNNNNNFRCNICGSDEYYVTNWDGLIMADPAMGMTCHDLDIIASSTNWDWIQCQQMSLVAFDACQCQTKPTRVEDEDSNDPNAGCYTDLDEVATLEEGLTSADIVFEREIILCPNTIFVMRHEGNQPKGNTTQEEGFDPIRPRPNAHYKCGHDGSALNNCVIQGGSFAIVTSEISSSSRDTSDDNITFEGITFESQIQATAMFDKRGDIVFDDCIFRVSFLLLSFVVVCCRCVLLL